MNASGAYVITVADRSLSDLIDVVHDVACRRADGSGRGWSARALTITDLEVERDDADPSAAPRSVAGVTLSAGAEVEVDVVFGLAGDSAVARFDAMGGAADTWAAARPLSFARYLSAATMHALGARGVHAELVRRSAC